MTALIIIIIILFLYSLCITLYILIIRKDYKHAKEARSLFIPAYLEVCMRFGEYKHQKGDL